jgi:hypothetical protein
MGIVYPVAGLPSEMVSAVRGLLALATETICIALWVMGHSFD